MSNSSTSNNYDFTIKQGETFNKVITWKDNAGTPVDLSNWAARMHLKIRLGEDETIILALTTENSRITLGSDGTVALFIEASVTLQLENVLYHYTLELVNGDNVKRLLQGRIDIDPVVTMPGDFLGDLTPPTGLPPLATLDGSELLAVLKNQVVYSVRVDQLPGQGFIDPHLYGAKGDAVSLPNATISMDYLSVSHAKYAFKDKDVGKTLYCAGSWQDNGSSSTIQSVANGIAYLSSPLLRNGQRYVLFGTDDTDALQAAFDAAERIMIDTPGNTNDGTGNGIPTSGAVVLRQGGYIVKNTQARFDAGKIAALMVPRRVGLYGQGQGSTAIYTAPGNVGHSIANKYANTVPANTAADEKITLADFSLYGLRDIQGAQCLNGIHLALSMGGYSMVDGYCQMYNINVHGARGRGIYLKGRGENFFTNVNVNFACDHGWYMDTTQDSRWVNCNAGGNYYAGFFIYDNAASSFTNCKSYYNGSNGGTTPELCCNWYISDANHSYNKGTCMFTACEGQESRGSSIVIDGGLNQFVNCLFSDPRRNAVGGTSQPRPTICAGIHMRKNASNNVFDGVFVRASLGLDWGGSTENHNGGDYALYIEDNLSGNAKLRGPRGNKGHIYTLEPSVYNNSKIGGVGTTNKLNCGLYVDGDPLPGAYPTAPTINRAVSWDNTTAAINFTLPSDMGGRAVRHYQIETKTGGGEWVAQKGATIVTNTLAKVTGLALGTTYQIRVAGVNVFGLGSYSAEYTYTHNIIYSMKRQLCSNNQRITPFTNSITELYINTTLHAKTPFNANWTGIRVHFDNFVANWNNGSEITTGMTSATMKCSVQVGDTIYPCTGTVSIAAGGQGYLDIPNLTLPAGTDFYVHTKATLPAGTKNVPQNTVRDMPMWDTGRVNTNDNSIDITVSGVSQGAVVGRTVAAGVITALSFNATTGKGTRFTATAPDVYAYEKQAGGVIAFKKIGTATTDGAGGVASVTLVDGTPPTGVTWVAPSIVVTNGSLYPDNGNSLGWAPNIITGIPDVPVRTVMLLGDTIMKGELVNTTDEHGNNGLYEVGIASRVGLGNAGIGGGIGAYRFTTSTMTRTMGCYAPYCTDAIVDLGYGDFINSRTAASTVTNLQAIRTSLVALGLKVNFATMLTQTSSTDGYVTEGNQTTGSNGLGVNISTFTDTVVGSILDNTIISDNNVINARALLLTGNVFKPGTTNDGNRPNDVIGAIMLNGISRAGIDAAFKACFNYLVN